MRGVLLFVVSLAACGDRMHGHSSDAAGDGAADSARIDSALADAQLEPVTVTVTYGAQPVVGVRVYFMKADGSLVLETTTDSNGAASGVVAAGGSVSVIDPFPTGGAGYHDARTFMAVTPGDHIDVWSPHPAGPTSMSIVASTDPGLLDTQASSPCMWNYGPLTADSGSATVHGSLALDAACAATDVLVVATNQTDSAFVFAAGIAVRDGTTLDLSSATYTPSVHHAVAYSNLPRPQRIAVRDFVLEGDAFVHDFDATIASGSSSTTTAAPLFPGASEMIATYLAPTMYSTQYFFDAGPFSSDVNIDVAAHSLDDFTAPPAYDKTTHTASVSVGTSTGHPPLFALVDIGVQRQSSGEQWNWSVVAPYSATLTPPELPDLPISENDVVSVSWVTGTAPGDYDSVLRNFKNFPNNMVVDLGGSATLVSSR